MYKIIYKQRVVLMWHYMGMVCLILGPTLTQYGKTIIVWDNTKHFQ